MTKILEGKSLGLKILSELQSELSSVDPKPALAIVQVGDKEESNLYIKKKKEFGEKAGFLVKHLKLSGSLAQADIISEIDKLNKNSEAHGIIVQMPLPKQIDFFKVIESINPRKDVDGLHSQNFKKLLEGVEDGFVPATAKGVLSILDFYQIPIAGKHAVVIGRSILVGKPVALLLLNRNATVTICHSHTKGLEEITQKADILITAMGVAQAIGKNHVSPTQTIIDVGINTISGLKMQEEVKKRKVVGDVHFEEVENVVSAITPVPGGVGPMTVASLFQNVLKAYKMQRFPR